MATNLSVPLAFVALLHLANEKVGTLLLYGMISKTNVDGGLLLMENEKLRFSRLIWLGTILSFRRNNQGILLPYHECSRRSDITQRLKVVPS